MVSLFANYRDCCRDIGKLLDLQSNIVNLEPKYSKAIAEVIVLRLFDIVVASFASIAVKIVCGARYVDGSLPLLLSRAPREAEAVRMMMSQGRPRSRVLHWTEAGQIRENVRYVLNTSDYFIRTLENHNLFIDETRMVRNRIAHSNKLARGKYMSVVFRYYGAKLNSLTPGTLLLSPRMKPTLLEKYILTSRTLIKTLVKA